MIATCPDALEADMQRIYGLNISELPPRRAAALAKWLPDGAMVWRALNLPNAWTSNEHLTACLVDQIHMWMWAQSDPKRRGPKPQPLPRPGDQPTTPHKRDDIRVMTVSDMDHFLARRFTDIKEP